jgi:hypothetical protein
MATITLTWRIIIGTPSTRRRHTQRWCHHRHRPKPCAVFAEIQTDQKSRRQRADAQWIEKKSFPHLQPKRIVISRKNAKLATNVAPEVKGKTTTAKVAAALNMLPTPTRPHRQPYPRRGQPEHRTSKHQSVVSLRRLPTQMGEKIARSVRDRSSTNMKNTSLPYRSSGTHQIRNPDRARTIKSVSRPHT